MVTISVLEPHKLGIDQRDALPPGEGEVAIQVIRAGICGSDMHILHGSNPFVTYPRIIGHEFAGVITALGRGVSHLAIGDHVVADPVISCGKCHPCRIGRSNVCAKLQVIGVHRDGGFRSVAIIPQEMPSRSRRRSALTLQHLPSRWRWRRMFYLAQNAALTTS